jgi:hypothetical protein
MREGYVLPASTGDWGGDANPRRWQWPAGHYDNTASMSDRASVRSVLHALWLRGLQAPASLRYGVGIVAALVPGLLRIAMNPIGA